MTDGYGRLIDYVRISVTDRCNLRCVYCMPEEGIGQTGHEEILTYEEIVRLCRIFASLGVSRIKLTGGEPLVRKGLSKLVRSLHAVPGIEEVTLTTNGICLKEQIEELYEAGIRGINISLDTLDADNYRKITRCGEIERVLEGIEACMNYPDIRLKINCVPLSGINDKELVRLAGIAKNYPAAVRFIEMMPIGSGKQWKGEPPEMILKCLNEAYGTPETVGKTFGNGPSSYVTYPGFAGEIGFISAVSHKFCGTCNRIRLTSEGYLKLCLQYTDGIDLKRLLRSGAGEEEIRQAVESAIKRKPKEHCFEQKESEKGRLEQRRMSEIGG